MGEAGAAIMKKGEAAIKEKIEEVKKEGLKKAEAAIKSKVDEKLLQKHQGSEDKKVSNLLQKGDDNDEDKGGSGLSDIVGAAKSGLKGAKAAIEEGGSSKKRAQGGGSSNNEEGGSSNKGKDRRGEEGRLEEGGSSNKVKDRREVAAEAPGKRGKKGQQLAAKG